jgi:hypothetical protein
MRTVLSRVRYGAFMVVLAAGVLANRVVVLASCGNGPCSSCGTASGMCWAPLHTHCATTYPGCKSISISICNGHFVSMCSCPPCG